MLGNSAFLESSRRESRKRRRLSERRRVFGRLAGATTGESELGAAAVGSFAQSRGERRRSSLFKREQQPQPEDETVPAFVMATGDQGKISMKIQFHITLAPDNEPLLLDACQLVAPASPELPAANRTFAAPNSSSPAMVKRQVSSDSASALGDHIHERLQRQSSSTRRRQQLLAMHQQSALEKRQAIGDEEAPRTGNIKSEDNLAFVRSSSINENPLTTGRDTGARSSTITGGMQDEATLQFLAKHQQQLRNNGTGPGPGPGHGPGSGSGSLLSQHQTLMSSANNIRHRQEQREHIYFKRDGQRFGHEFTLKLAVDRSYRCLLKVRPLIPLEALTIQGHHVSFVDCSAHSSSFSSSASSGLGSSISSSAPVSSITLSGGEQYGNSRHQSIGNILSGGPRHNSIAAPNNLTIMKACINSPHQQNNNRQLGQAAHPHRRLDHAMTTIGSGTSRRTSILNSELVRGKQAQQQDDTTGSNHSLAGGTQARLQQLLLKQHQHNQMVRHFSGSSSTSSSHMGGQLVYMFDWSADRFEVNKNKARTQMQTVLKFRNGQILSLPLQVKFYQPECRQHLSWGSQLHFIDYDCNIDSMGQMNIDRIQYY